MDTSLKKLRKNLNFSQGDLVKMIGIPLNTLQNWEQGVRKPSNWVLTLIMDRMLQESREKENQINERTGILTLLEITRMVRAIASQYEINKVLLFGSYVKGKAKPRSDIDLYIEASLTGLAYFDFTEKLRQSLNKKIDLFSNLTLDSNSSTYLEIEDTGITIYER